MCVCRILIRLSIGWCKGDDGTLQMRNIAVSGASSICDALLSHMISDKSFDDDLSHPDVACRDDGASMIRLSS